MRKLRNLKWKILALLARWGILLPGKIMYIGGSDTLPPPLKREEEAALIVRMGEGDEKAKNILIEHNLRLVVYIAKRFENTGINIEDLISIGTIGLIKAVSTFKAEKKYSAGNLCFPVYRERDPDASSQNSQPAGRDLL